MALFGAQKSTFLTDTASISLEVVSALCRYMQLFPVPPFPCASAMILGTLPQDRLPHSDLLTAVALAKWAPALPVKRKPQFQSR